MGGMHALPLALLTATALPGDESIQVKPGQRELAREPEQVKARVIERNLRLSRHAHAIKVVYEQQSDSGVFSWVGHRVRLMRQM